VRAEAPARALSAPTAPVWFGTLFLGLIVLAPLPFGSNRPVWWSLLGLATTALTLCYLVLIAKQGPSGTGLRLRPVAGFLVPFTAALIWAACQMLPLGPAEDLAANPLWPLAGEALSRAVPAAVSLDPHETGTGMLRLLTYGLVFWLALELGRRRGFAERALRWLAYAGLAYAGYGLLMHVLGIERILWFPKWAYEGFITSTFINRNSYATYAALGLLAALAVLVDTLRLKAGAPRAKRAAARAVLDRLAGPALLPLITCLVIATALAGTGSRAGMLSLALGLIVFGFAAAFARLIRLRYALAGILLLAGLLGTMIALQGGALIDRLEADTLDKDRSARTELYALTLDATRDNPLLGAGLGTFPEVFSMYRDASFDTLGPIGKAHNSYLGNALELGIPAALLILVALLAIAERSLTGLRRRRRARLFPVLGLAVLIVVALHSTVDFSLEIPAVGVTFAALMGITCAQSLPSTRRVRKKPVLKVVKA
jgi:O-antigen ligase